MFCRIPPSSRLYGPLAVRGRRMIGMPSLVRASRFLYFLERHQGWGVLFWYTLEISTRRGVVCFPLYLIANVLDGHHVVLPHIATFIHSLLA